MVHGIIHDDTIFGIAPDTVLGAEEADQLNVGMSVQIVGRRAKAAVDPRVVGDQTNSLVADPWQFIVEQTFTTETNTHVVPSSVSSTGCTRRRMKATPPSRLAAMPAP